VRPVVTPGQRTTWVCIAIRAAANRPICSRTLGALGFPRIWFRRAQSVVCTEMYSGDQALRDDARHIRLCQIGQRGEIAVEEGEAVVVILEVERAAHAGGVLVGEAEGALVVARVHLEGFDVQAERQIVGLRDRRPPLAPLAVPPDQYDLLSGLGEAEAPGRP